MDKLLKLKIFRLATTALISLEKEYYQDVKLFLEYIQDTTKEDKDENNDWAIW